MYKRLTSIALKKYNLSKILPTILSVTESQNCLVLLQLLTKAPHDQWWYSNSGARGKDFQKLMFSKKEL